MSAHAPLRRPRPGLSAPAANLPLVSERAALRAIALGAVLTTILGLAQAPQPILPTIPLVAHLTGLLAGYGVAVMLILMARVPALERGVGADRLARWHALGGRSVLVLMLVHGVAATIGWAQVQNENVLAAAIQVMQFPGLVAATVATLLFVAVGVVSARAVRRRVRYETWHLLHFGTYFAIALSFVHELARPHPARLPLVPGFWGLLCPPRFGPVPPPPL